MDNPAGQLDAAAAGAEVDELEFESLDELDEVELDFSDDEELVDSEPLAEPLDELVAELFADSRLSVREKPLPLNTTPTLPKSLRSRPLHSGQVVSAASLKACTASNRLLHSVHA